MEVFGKVAEQYGLFVALVVWVIYDSRQRETDFKKTNLEREHGYQAIINKLTDKFDILQDVKRDVDDIKDYIRR